MALFSLPSLAHIVAFPLRRSPTYKYISVLTALFRMSWTTGNAGSETRRGVNMAMLNTIGHSMAILGSYIYPSREGPAYTRGFAICCAFAWWGALLALLLSYLLRLENRRRDLLEGKPTPGETPNTAVHADKAEGFRYVL